MRWLLAALLVAVEALTTYAAPSGCSGECITIPMKEYLDTKVALVNSERDFTACSNKLSQNQAANRFVRPDQ